MKITKTAIEFILETSKNVYPNEFVGLLRAENNVIIEVLLFPGSKFEENRSSIFMNMVPLDPTIVGSVHSHPGAPQPSRADLKFFEKNKVNIIAGYPYNLDSLAVFNSNGNPIELEIVK